MNVLRTTATALRDGELVAAVYVRRRRQRRRQLDLVRGAIVTDRPGTASLGRRSRAVVAAGRLQRRRPPRRGGGDADSNTVSVLLNDGDWSPDDPPSVSIRDATVTEGNTGTVNATFTLTLSHASDRRRDGPLRHGGHHRRGRQRLHGRVRDRDHPGRPDQQDDHGRGQRRPPRRAERDLRRQPQRPTNATIGDGQGVGTILDDEPRISISDVTKAEGKKGKTTLFTFTVTLSAAYDQPVTMSFRTVNGTATTSDNDYVAKTGTLTFAPGETTKTITIEVKGDSKREANETFYLDLFGNSSNALFTKNRGIGTILNDD